MAETGGESPFTTKDVWKPAAGGSGLVFASGTWFSVGAANARVAVKTRNNLAKSVFISDADIWKNKDGTQGRFLGGG